MISRELKAFLETNVITSGATLKIEPSPYDTNHTIDCTVNLIQPVNYDKYCVTDYIIQGLNYQTDKTFIESLGQWVKKNGVFYTKYKNWFQYFLDQIHTIHEGVNKQWLEREQAKGTIAEDDYDDDEGSVDDYFSIYIELPNTKIVEFKVFCGTIFYMTGYDESDYNRYIEECSRVNSTTLSPPDMYEAWTVYADYERYEDYEESIGANYDKIIAPFFKQQGFNACTYDITELYDFYATYPIIKRVYELLCAMQRKTQTNIVKLSQVQELYLFGQCIDYYLRKYTDYNRLSFEDVGKIQIDMTILSKISKLTIDQIYKFVTQIKNNPTLLDTVNFPISTRMWFKNKLGTNKRLFKNVTVKR